MYILLRLVRFALKYKVRLGFAYLSVLAVTIFALAVPRLLGIAVDEVVGLKNAFGDPEGFGDLTETNSSE